ncbi:unnamed protein product [Leuciscus chuanchicus]
MEFIEDYSEKPVKMEFIEDYCEKPVKIEFIEDYSENRSDPDQEPLRVKLEETEEQIDLMEEIKESEELDEAEEEHRVKTEEKSLSCSQTGKTALVRVTNDLLVAAEQCSPSLLLLLDLSATFNTVDHAILLHHLQQFISISHTAFQWFRSYLTDRVAYVALGGARSRPHTVTCGVPQGSVLGPTLFSIYMLPLGHIISRHGVAFHCYADDTQLYVRMDPTSSGSSLSTLTACLEETKTWMTDNFLQLNSSKTEGLLIGTPHQLRSSPLTVYSYAGHDIPLTSSITNLGVRLDPHLSFNTHIQLICKTAFFHLRNISKLCPSLSLSDAEKLVHAFVSSRLDYCNALLIGIQSKKFFFQGRAFTSPCTLHNE